VAELDALDADADRLDPDDIDDPLGRAELVPVLDVGGPSVSKGSRTVYLQDNKILR
jgi:hypothetical protein